MDELLECIKVQLVEFLFQKIFYRFYVVVGYLFNVFNALSIRFAKILVNFA